jgi:hypothetical protein
MKDNEPTNLANARSHGEIGVPQWEERLKRETSAAMVPLWLREDRTREQGLEYWRGPHGRIAAQTPGLLEYRQHHFEADGPGVWPDISDVETAIQDAGRMDGVPETTFESAASVLKGLRTRRAIFADEANVFARTILYVTGPGGGRWWREDQGETAGRRTVVMLRRRGSVGFRAFRRWVNDDFGRALAGVPGMLEVRTLAFLPYVKQLWSTPRVAHDELPEWRYQAAVVLGARDHATLDDALASEPVAATLNAQREHCSAIHAYPVDNTYVFRRHGRPTTAPIGADR